MTRLWYGGAPADFEVAQGAEVEILDEAGAGSSMIGTSMLLPLTSIALDVFTDAALTTPTTDLLDSNGDPVSQIMTLIEFDDRGAVPRFQGPDGHEGPLWLSVDAVTGFRFEPDSEALYTRVTAAETTLVTVATDITTLEASVVSLDGRLDTLEAPADSPDVQYFTASGTWTKPAGARRVFAEVQGGGGGGGGAATTAAGQGSEGGGGGGGGYAAEWYDAGSLSATETVTVGTGGTVSAGASGGNGGSSFFGASLFGADGGGGGSAGAASIGGTIANGGSDGTGFDNGGGAPSIQRRSGGGKPGIVQGTTGVTMRMNAGGSSEGSGDQRLTPVTASGSGVAGIRGSGGSGGRNAASQGSARSGGAGGAGYVRVTTYF